MPEKGYTEAIPNVRKVRRWLKRYQESGSDIRSLLDMTHLRGNKASRIDAKVEEICMDVLQTFYLKKERPTLKYAHSLARDRVRKENELRNVMDMLPIPTITTLKSVLKRIAITDIYAARHGKNAARIKFRSSIGSAVVDRPFQRWEVDHTRLDQVIVCEITGIVLGRPWLTVVIDRFTRAVMGYGDRDAIELCGFIGAVVAVVLACLILLKETNALQPLAILFEGPAFHRSQVIIYSLSVLYGFLIRYRESDQIHFLNSENTQNTHKIAKCRYVPSYADKE